MARTPRFERISESNYYHVTARGAGRRVIFEDDEDRTNYLKALFSYVDDSTGELIAWCLMDNHVHLLFHMEIHELSALIHRLHTKHGQFFNGRHGHVGPVFQGRYDCVPVETDEQLIQTVRYIHLNPKDLDHGAWQSYPWSSYPGYLEGSSHCKSTIVLDILGGPAGFERFHTAVCEVSMMRIDGYKPRLSDAEATEVLRARFGAQFADALTAMPRAMRDRKLAECHDLGLSTRQIERLTGIGRGAVSRALSRQ